MVSYISKPAFKAVPHFGKLNLKTLFSYAPNLALWGSASTFGLLVYTEGIPVVQDAVYKKLPFIGDYWVKTVDPENQPF